MQESDILKMAKKCAKQHYKLFDDREEMESVAFHYGFLAWSKAKKSEHLYNQAPFAYVWRTMCRAINRHILTKREVPTEVFLIQQDIDRRESCYIDRGVDAAMDDNKIDLCDRDIIRLRMDGNTHEEIASKLGYKDATEVQNIFRGLRQKYEWRIRDAKQFQSRV